MTPRESARQAQIKRSEEALFQEREKERVWLGPSKEEAEPSNQMFYVCGLNGNSGSEFVN